MGRQENNVEMGKEDYEAGKKINGNKR